MLEYTVQVLFFGFIFYWLWTFATESPNVEPPKAKKKTKKKTVKRKKTTKKN